MGVSDGDTVALLDAAHQQHKNRLAGIDAPEKSQAFGQRAKERLSDRVFGQPVTVEGSKTDRYGRLAGKVIVSCTDANLIQLRAGMAWHYKQYEKEQTPADRQRYAQTERAAQDQRRGCGAMPTRNRHGISDMAGHFRRPPRQKPMQPVPVEELPGVRTPKTAILV